MCGEGGFAGFALMGSAIWVAVTGLSSSFIALQTLSLDAEGEVGCGLLRPINGREPADRFSFSV